MKLLISALLVAVAVAIKHSSVHSFVDVSSASVVRTITTVHLEEPLAAADAYLVSVPNAVFVKAECDKSCTVGKVSSGGGDDLSITSKKGAQVITVTYAATRAQKAMPEAVEQVPKSSKDASTQYLVYSRPLGFPTPYPTASQTVAFRMPNSDIKSATPISPIDKKGKHVTYGPFDDSKKDSIVTLHYQTNHAILNAEYWRTVQVSQWAGTLSFEDRYVIHHDGAKLKGHYSNIDYRMFNRKLGETNVVKSFPLRLPPFARDVYFKDSIGNVSTSNFRPSSRNSQKSELEIRPRYPLYGGWKYDFFYGFKVPAAKFLQTQENDFELRINLFDSLKNISFDQVTFEVQLPEGASINNVAYEWKASVKYSKSYSFLDSVGRPTVTFQLNNAIDELAGPVVILYSFPPYMYLIKPLAVATFLFAFFIASMIYTRSDFSIEADPKIEIRKKLAAALARVSTEAARVDGLFDQQKNAFADKSVDAASQLVQEINKTLDGGFGPAGKEVVSLYRERLKLVLHVQAEITQGKAANGDAVLALDSKIRDAKEKLKVKLK